MALLKKKKYSFTSGGADSQAFTVVSFKGFEAISKPYEFDILLVSDQTNIDPLKVMKNKARFIIHRDKGEDVSFNGILIQFEETREYSGFHFYRARLVPKLHWLSYTHHNQVFLKKSAPEIMAAVLKDGGLSSGIDFDFKLQQPGLGSVYENTDDAGYRMLDYVCQYDESHFNFVSRWAEREGIYYFFQQTLSGEKLIFSNSKIIHRDLPLGKELIYDPPSGLSSQHTDEVVQAFICRHNMLPQKVLLKDYNYMRPSMPLEGKADVDRDGRGETYVYGVHFDTEEEGNHLAKIRAQALLCRKSLFSGQSTVPFIMPGYTFDLTRYYKDGYNRKYLVTEVTHQGHQTGYLLSGLGDAVSPREEEMAYSNSFTAIYAQAQFRPEHKTLSPKISGTINAKVDAGASGEYAELNEQGEYKVVLPFDLSGRSGGKASAWLRMMQPYAGKNQGMHFPLHKDTEVLLTFIDGNPDRPVIAGAVPNPESGSPVTDNNQTHSMIMTGRGPKDAQGAQQLDDHNYILFNDMEAQEQITSHSPGMVELYASGTNALIQSHTPGTVQVEAGARYRRLELGTSEESGHDRYNDAGDQAISIDDAEIKVEDLIRDIESCAPGNVLGYDEKAELPEDDTSMPEHFPWAYVKAPVPDCPSEFETFFNDTPDIRCYTNGTADDYDYYTLDGLYDDVDTAWNEYWCYWVHRHKNSYPNAKGYQDVTYINHTPSRPRDKPWYYDSGWDTAGNGSKRLRDYLDNAALDAYCQTEWDSWVDEKKENMKKWWPHVCRGHVQAHHRDTFRLQQGNVYDFMGHNTYRLGNQYREAHIDSGDDLNDQDDFDMLGAGGPNWTEFRTIKSSLEGGSSNELDSFWGKGDWDPGKVFVKKKWGDSYEYVKGNKISVVNGNSHKIVIGGKTIEEKYGSNADGTGKTKRRYYKSGGGEKWEKKWSKSGKLLSSSHAMTSGSKYDIKHEFKESWVKKTKASKTYAAQITSEIKFAAHETNKIYVGARHDNKLYLAAKTSISIGASRTFKFSIHAGLHTDVPIYMAAKAKIGFKRGADIAIESNNALAFKLNLSAAIRVGIDVALLSAKRDCSGGFKILVPGLYCEHKAEQVDLEADAKFSGSLKTLQMKL